jgi:glutamine cyclotransferase
MSNPSIEMVSKNASSTGSSVSNDPGIDDDDDDDDDDEKQLAGDDSVLMSSIRRQNKWCGCMFVLVLSSLAVFLVGRIYMTPEEGGDFLLPLDETEQGGMVNNDAVNDKPSRDHSSIISSLLANSTKSHGSSRDKSDLQTWLQNHGHVPPNLRNNPTPQAPSQETNVTSISNGDEHAGETSNEPTFHLEKWLNSTVTLEDGVMFETMRELKHDGAAFLEGLTFAQGFLFESTGLAGESSIRKLDPDTGDALESYDLLDKTIFGEGLAVAHDKVYQLTYKKKMGFIYDIKNITQPTDTFAFESTTGEGWGLTFADDTNELIMSDGSDFLHMIDPDTLLPTRKVKVTRDGNKNADNINELEYFHGRVLANVWYQDIMLVINPTTGMVEKEYDFTNLWLLSERSKKGAGVLNGISVSNHPGYVYVTGKNWERMFLVE